VVFPTPPFPVTANFIHSKPFTAEHAENAEE